MNFPFLRPRPRRPKPEPMIMPARDVSRRGKPIEHGFVYKANIGDEASRQAAILTTIVVAKGPLEAHVLLRTWAKGGDLEVMINDQHYYLELVPLKKSGVY